MKPTSVIKATLFAASLTLAAPLAGTTSLALAQDASTVVAKVGSRSITNADVDQAGKRLAQQFQNVPEAERRARVLDALIDFSILAQRAEAEGIDKTDDVKRTLDYLRVQALHNAYFTQKIQPTITDEALKSRYDAQTANAKPEKEVKARHILVKTEDEAKAIIKELEGGADFVELAKTKSTGPSGPQGGDLGFFGKGRMVPEFEKAAFAMEAGSFTKEPVKTQFGFHVLKVDEVRDVALPTFEASKEQLRNVAMSEAYAEAIKEGRASNTVEILDKSLVVPEQN